MPGYPGAGKAYLLNENQQYLCWIKEAVAVGESSFAVQLRRNRGNFYPWGVSVELSFSANPGAFQCDVQIADTDADANYITIGSITNVNAGFVGRLDLTTLWPKFLRLNMVSLANAVNVTAQVTR